jgi:hypothetical protein
VGAGIEAGRLDALAALPFGADWIVAADPGAGFGGLAYVGTSGHGTVYAVDGSGTVSAFATGLDGVTGLAFSAGGLFGRGLYASDGAGEVVRIDSTGAPEAFAAHGFLLQDAASLAFDPPAPGGGPGSFGGDLFVGNPALQQIVRVSPAGDVSAFASGLAGLSGGDALAFGPDGDLYAVEPDAPGGARVSKIVPRAAETGLTGAALPGSRPTLRLRSAAPNPFNPRTRIGFDLPEAGPVRLTVHDVQGRLVATLLDEERRPGPHEIVWEGRDSRGRPVASGVYFLRLEAVGGSEASRVVLTR